MQNIFISIKNDTKLEKEIYTVVENSKFELKNFVNNFRK